MPPSAAASRCPAIIRDGFEKKFDKPIYEGYGLTETIGPIAFNVPGRRRPVRLANSSPARSQDCR